MKIGSKFENDFNTYLIYNKLKRVWFFRTLPLSSKTDSFELFLIVIYY